MKSILIVFLVFLSLSQVFAKSTKKSKKRTASKVTKNSKKLKNNFKQLSMSDIGNIQSLLIHLLEGKNKTINLNRDHPYYAPAVISKLVGKDKSVSNAELIKYLEDLLTLKEFSGQIGVNSIHIGTVKSYTFWRDALYLSLGRAYYESGDPKKALKYYDGILASSFLSRLSFLEKGWAYLKLNEIEQSRKNLEFIKSNVVTKMANSEKQELLLQEMYVLVKEGKYEDAIKYNNQFKLNHVVLNALRHKVMAQAYFDKFLKNTENYDFKQKVTLLNQILGHAEKVISKERDSQFSFLASEAYWHRASAYRVEAPIKNKNIWNRDLGFANNWIKPWVDQSIKKQKALITEEAMFFSIALQWEREEFNDAVKRLINLPKLFPQGEYLEDAYQLLGDYYFDRKNFSRAIGYYSKLSTFGDEQKAAYGVYKAAWSFYNLDKKWKSLRHFERLLLFYQKQRQKHGDEFVKNDKIGLVAESERDLLTIMAELLTFKQGIEEFKIFNLKPDRLIDFESRLGKKFQSIGKFNEAVKTYKYLLKRYAGHKENLNWLNELLQTHLAAGTRKRIAVDLNAHYPKIKKDGDYTKQEYAEFQKSLRTIVLTVHKEARKSDDMAIWVAIDGLYKGFMKHFQDSNDGDIWYFGAQRQERMKRKWEAVKWYEKAGQIKSYANHVDASLSVLRIVNDVLEERSLTKASIKNSKSDFVKGANAAKWYFTTFANTPQHELAEYLYVENLYYAGMNREVNLFLAQTFHKEKVSKKRWNLYLALNKKYYDNKQYESANELARFILKKSGTLDVKNWSFVQNIFQETSFLLAIELEAQAKKLVGAKKSNQTDTKKIIDKSRYWYGEAINVAPDAERQLKAWNNLLLSYNIMAETEFVKKEFERFDNFAKLNNNKLNAFHSYLSNIYLYIADSYGKIGEHRSKALSLTKGSVYIEKSNLKNDLLWEALVLYGIEQDFEQFEQLEQYFKKTSPQFLNRPENQVAIAKLYFYAGKDIKSWNVLSTQLNSSKLPNNAWILFGDLFRKSKNHKKLKEVMEKYLISKKESLLKNVFIRPIWSQYEWENYSSKKLQWNSLISKLTPTPLDDATVLKFASTTYKDRKNFSQADMNVIRLKIKLADIKRYLQTLGTVKKEINTEIAEWRPQISSDALCLAAEKTKSVTLSLKGLKSEKVNSAQWPALVKNMKNKINQLAAVYKKENQACNEFKEVFTYLSPVERNESPMCSFGDCYSPRTLSRNDFQVLATKLKGSNDTEAMFWAYLSSGAFAKAEFLALSSSNKSWKSLHLGIVRLFLNDSWNAWSLFSEAKKNSKLASDVLFYQSLTEYAYGHKNKALSQLKQFKKNQLKKWQIPYYEGLIDKIKSSRKTAANE